jgi:hypothetical protein
MCRSYIEKYMNFIEICLVLRKEKKRRKQRGVHPKVARREGDETNENKQGRQEPKQVRRRGTSVQSEGDQAGKPPCRPATGVLRAGQTEEEESRKHQLPLSSLVSSTPLHSALHSTSSLGRLRSFQRFHSQLPPHPFRSSHPPPNPFQIAPKPPRRPGARPAPSALAPARCRSPIPVARSPPAGFLIRREVLCGGGRRCCVPA